MTNIFASYSKIIAGTLVAVLIASNILFIGTVLLIPKKAEATWPTITMVNIADELKEIARGLVITFATRFVNQFLTRFINRLVEKYKIRNYLYYDQILSNYYLTNYIRDKVQDPDLQRIYDLLNSAYITGQNTGLPGQPAPNNAVIPQLRQAIYDHYIQVGGVPNDFLNQPQNYSAANYYRSAQSYYLNHPSYTERHLSGQFGGFQANSTTAAQLEVIVGNGLKAGRALGGTCELSGEATSGSNPNGSPQACAAAGGTWRASSFDQARSFIDNPAGFIDKHLGSAISTMFNVNYDPSKNSFYFQIGSLLGSFLFNRLFLDSPAGAPLNEDPRLYVPSNAVVNNGAPIDIDGDGIVDGYDTNGDGQPEICIYGGTNSPTGPPCQGSVASTTAPPPPGPCVGAPSPESFRNELQVAINQVNANNPGGIADAPNTAINGDIYRDEVIAILVAQGMNASRNVINGNGNLNTIDLIAIWGPGDSYAERYDMIIAGGAGDRPMRQAATANQPVGLIPVSSCVQ